MNTNRNKLALRRQSIRTLDADEMRIAHGGKPPTGGGTGTGNDTNNPTTKLKTHTGSDRRA
jgi:hypothetical protein